MQRDTSPSQRVDQAVDCGLWNVVPLIVDPWVLEHAVANVDREHCVHAQWVTFLVIRCTNPCDMGLCIGMLKHEEMVAVDWHDNWPQDLVKVSLCI